MRGLIASLSTEPDMTQARFEELAELVFRDRSQLRNIAGAPDLVISLMYPMAGNENAIGLDYRTSPSQRDSALKARDTGELVLDGPVQLVQGGLGFVGRFPVFVDGPGRGGSGASSPAVVDAERLYRDSGLLAHDLPIDIALAGTDANGALKPFFGDASVFNRRPVDRGGQRPVRSLEACGRAEGRLGRRPDNDWFFRPMLLIAGALVVDPAAGARPPVPGTPASLQDARPQ